MVHSQTTLASAVVPESRRSYQPKDIRVFESVIPRSARFVTAPAFQGKPAVLVDTRNLSVKVYCDLFEEVLGRDPSHESWPYAGPHEREWKPGSCPRRTASQEYVGETFHVPRPWWLPGMRLGAPTDSLTGMASLVASLGRAVRDWCTRPPWGPLRYFLSRRSAPVLRIRR